MLSATAAALTPNERARLAQKGRILYGKFCGTKGRGSCAESFALHQLQLGQVEPVADLADFLDAQVAALAESDPAGLLAMTVALAARIRRHLDAEGKAEEPDLPEPVPSSRRSGRSE